MAETRTPRMGRRLMGLAGGLTLCLLGLFVLVAPAGMPAWAGEQKIAKAPDFSSVDTLGSTRTLSDYLGKRPVLLEFMSLGCPYCVEMAPILSRVHGLYGDRVQFLTVVFEQDPKRIQQFVRMEKHAWPYLVGTKPMIDAYQLQGVPTVFFLLKDGRIFRNHVGLLPEQGMRETLDALLKAK